MFLLGARQHSLVIRGIGFGFRCVEILALPPASCRNLEKLLKLRHTSVSPDCEIEVNHNYFLKLLGEVNMKMYESTSSPLPFSSGKLLFRLQPLFHKCHYFKEAFPNGHRAFSRPPCYIQSQQIELSLCKYTSWIETVFFCWSFINVTLIQDRPPALQSQAHRGKYF